MLIKKHGLKCIVWRERRKEKKKKKNILWTIEIDIHIPFSLSVIYIILKVKVAMNTKSIFNTNISIKIDRSMILNII